MSDQNCSGLLVGQNCPGFGYLSERPGLSPVPWLRINRVLRVRCGVGGAEADRRHKLI